jgi:hypothetical protein
VYNSLRGISLKPLKDERVYWWQSY